MIEEIAHKGSAVSKHSGSSMGAIAESVAAAVSPRRRRRTWGRGEHEGREEVLWVERERSKS
jgi:hypothetical protein